MPGKSDRIIKSSYFLRSGFIYVPDTATHIATALGSSVSVCIYDKKRNAGGMNHFQLPFINKKRLATARYGNVAIIALIQMLINDGSKVKHMEAQIFGGAYNPGISDRDIGRENIKSARNILSKKRIQIVSEDVGGRKGRKIVFKTRTNEIAVMRVDQLRKGDWYPYEEER